MGKFKNRSERNEKVLTSAMIFFKDKDVLTKRPEGMEFEAYKALQMFQRRLLKKIFVSKPNPKISQLFPLRIGYNYHVR